MSSANRLPKAFTLIELLVTIAIIGLLVSIVTIGTANSQQTARDAQRVKDIQVIATGIESYAADHQGGYPIPVTSNGTPTSRQFPEKITYQNGGNDNPYISVSGFVKYFPKNTIPVDPRPLYNNQSATDEWRGYVYQTQYGAGNRHKTSYAFQQSVSYTLSMALENPKSADQTQLLDKLSCTNDTIKASNCSVLTNLAGRYRYIFNGPACRATIIDASVPNLPPRCYVEPAAPPL